MEIKTEKQKIWYRNYMKKRYHNDEEFRKKMILSNCIAQRVNNKNKNKNGRIISLKSWVTRLENKPKLSEWEKLILKENKEEIRQNEN